MQGRQPANYSENAVVKLLYCRTLHSSVKQALLFSSNKKHLNTSTHSHHYEHKKEKNHADF